MGRKSEQNRCHIPPPKTLDGLDEAVPFFLVDDEKFPLNEWLMHPFAGKQLTHEIRKFFNYRLSRARKILQNSFGVLVSRWKIFQKPIEEKLELVKKKFTCYKGTAQTDNADYF